MADCCDNCKQGKVCCSIEAAGDHDHHDHDHAHSNPSAAPSRSRGASPRTRRMSDAKPRSNPSGGFDTTPVLDGVALNELARAQAHASARASSLAIARPNPAPSGQALTPTQRVWAVRIAAGAAIVGGVALGYYGLKRAGKI